MIFFNFRASSRLPSDLWVRSTSDQIDSSPWRWWNLRQTRERLISEWISSSPIIAKSMLSGNPSSEAWGAELVHRVICTAWNLRTILPTTSSFGRPVVLLFGRGPSSFPGWNLPLIGAGRFWAIQQHTLLTHPQPFKNHAYWQIQTLQSMPSLAFCVNHNGLIAVPRED